MKMKTTQLGLALVVLVSSLVLSCKPDQEVKPSEISTTSTEPAKAIGHLSYRLVRVSNPTADQQDAYNRITNAMNAAVAMYNGQTDVTKAVTVYYEPSVPTADGNMNGTVRFGSNRSYMTQCTAMHEIAHTLGVGQSARYQQLVVNGRFTGANALSMLRSMVGESQNSVLYADRQHFWPYGLNQNSEWSTVNGQRHARIVGAMKRDGI